MRPNLGQNKPVNKVAAETLLGKKKKKTKRKNENNNKEDLN